MSPAGSGEAAAFPIIVSGPSGAGKTTLCRRMTDGPRGRELAFSVSMTTRAPREGERDGTHYHFVSRAEFEARVEAGVMLEHARVHGELYGTPQRNLERARAEGRHLLLDIDVQGARQVLEAAPEALALFLVPPSGARIARQLRGRGSETSEQLAERLAGAHAELAAGAEFDDLIVNDRVERAEAAAWERVDQRRRALSCRGGSGFGRAGLGSEARAHLRRIAAELPAKRWR